MKTRLKFEFLTLELIDTRRKAEHRPFLALDVERRIIDRHLRELEALAGAESGPPVHHSTFPGGRFTPVLPPAIDR